MKKSRSTVKKREILVFGNFDLLHPGHKYFLRMARKYGDKLIVVVTRDQVAKKARGYKLAQTEKTRLKAVQNLPSVDKAMLGDKKIQHNFSIIKKIKPKVLALGHDQKWNLTELKKIFKNLKLDIKVVRIKAYKRKLYRSSLFRK